MTQLDYNVFTILTMNPPHEPQSLIPQDQRWKLVHRDDTREYMVGDHVFHGRKRYAVHCEQKYIEQGFLTVVEVGYLPRKVMRGGNLKIATPYELYGDVRYVPLSEIGCY